MSIFPLRSELGDPASPSSFFLPQIILSTETRKHGMKLINERFTGTIIQAAIEVHKALGPGFLECIYEKAFCAELEWRNIRFDRQRLVKIFYRGIEVGSHRIDLIIDDQVVVELKAAQDFDSVYFAQIKSYLKATGLNVGLLMNFNKPTLAIKRFVL